MENKPDNQANENKPANPEAEQNTKNTKAKTKFAWFNAHLTAIFLAVVLFVLPVAITIYVIATDDRVDQSNSTSQNQVGQVEGAQQLSAAISLVEGTVQYSSDGTMWLDASGGETVAESDYIRSLELSRAVLLFDDGSAVRLDASTTVYLSSANTDNIEVLLSEGQVYSRVVESQSRRFVVSTSNDNFEALGTAYKTSTSETGDTVEVYHSIVKINSDQTEVEAGNKYDTQSKEKQSLNQEDVENDEFIQWNKQKDQSEEKFKDKLGFLADRAEEPAPTNSTTPTVVDNSASISLSASAVDNGVSLSWSLNNAGAPNGFKIVRAIGDNTPTYKQDQSLYVGADKRQTTWQIKDGKTYFFRVCIYRPDAGSCDTYSNAAQVTAPYSPPTPVEAGEVSLTIDGSTIYWEISGTAPHGFKVLLSATENPTYPSNSLKYVGAETRQVNLPDKPAGNYYVKVCKYTDSSEINGGCTDYSNQVTYAVD